MPARIDAENDLLTATEVAAYLRVSVRTFNRLHLAGRGPNHLLVGRQRRWRRSDVATWIENELTGSHQDKEIPS